MKFFATIRSNGVTDSPSPGDIRAELSGAEKEPENQTEEWQQKDDQNPQNLVGRGGRALDRFYDGPEVNSEDDDADDCSHNLLLYDRLISSFLFLRPSRVCGY